MAKCRACGKRFVWREIPVEGEGLVWTKFDKPPKGETGLRPHACKEKKVIAETAVERARPWWTNYD